MTESTRVVLDGSSIPAEDDLRLPRPPGVIRRFWARHPRLADVLLVVLALLLSIPTFALGSIEPGAERIAIGWLIVGLVLAVGTSVSLMWRRRYPLTVFIITFSPIAVLDPCSPRAPPASRRSSPSTRSPCTAARARRCGRWPRPSVAQR
ncbi:hypothetical protein [Microbacterium sp. NIBRBAC000506063]|uniref:DUF7134 domain-containing protein n=1 Tax=Microbacterium sp. NIBRBAC000506063 TaxID=2734618 RepID=UPI001BB4EA1A|nr:hypothetical protein [Microbacterium sp. NIBRBAC000506063]QTV80515.1 hypothetical protein KAE78_06415 [Microbacterium sp. NIBRBAC000506063]